MLRRNLSLVALLAAALAFTACGNPTAPQGSSAKPGVIMGSGT